MTLGLPSMPPSHMCNAQVFQSTDGGFTGKAPPWSKQEKSVEQGLEVAGSQEIIPKT